MINNLIASFFDHNRQAVQVFDFNVLGVDFEIAKDLKEAFSEMTGHYAGRSRYQFWRCLKHFSGFLADAKINKCSTQKDFLTRYGRWLQKNNRLRATNGTYFIIARRLCAYMAENGGLELWRGQNTLRFDFSREQYSSRQNEVSVKSLKDIAQACKSEISITFDNLSVRNYWDDYGTLPEMDLPKSQTIILNDLFSLEKKGVWSQSQMALIKRGRLGSVGLRNFLKYRELTINTLLPFYVLLMIQTGANPISLMEIKIDCMESHPTDEKLFFLSWEKPRSGKEQSLPMLKAGKYGAFRLLNFIIRNTAHLRHLSNTADQSMLFVSRTGHKVRRLSIQGLHDALNIFRDTHALPYFTFSDIRKSVACVIDAAAPSLAVASKFLNHQHSNTTALYLKGRVHSRVKYERIAGYQGKLVESAKNFDAATTATPYQTVFGIDCTDPLNSPIPNARKGMPCVEYLSCATCSNALIIKDNPVGIARILKAQVSLDALKVRAARDADMQLRFEALYAPILKIIRENIIPNIPIKTIRSAEKILVDIPDIPILV